MTEQFGINRSFGYSTTVYSNVCPMLTRAIGMYNLRKHLFTDTTFTSNQYRKVSRSYPYRHLQGFVQSRIITNYVESLFERR